LVRATDHKACAAIGEQRSYRCIRPRLAFGHKNGATAQIELVI